MDYSFTPSINRFGFTPRASVHVEKVQELVLTDLVDLRGQLFYSDFKEAETHASRTTRFGSLLFYATPRQDNLAQLTIENVRWEDSSCRLLHVEPLEYSFDGLQKQLRSLSFCSEPLATEQPPVLSVCLSGHLRYRCGCEQPFTHRIQLQVGVDQGW